MRSTVADVDLDIERFKQLLENSAPTLFKCMPLPEQLPTSPFDAFYTLYSIHEFNDFLDALEKRDEHIARYVLSSTGELCFGHEGEPGKTIAEHWQMVGDNPMIIAAGNIFVEDGKITGLSDQSPCTTGILSLIYALRALHNNNLPLALNLELIQSIPDQNGQYSSPITKIELQQIITKHTFFEYDLEEDLIDEDDIFVDGVRAEASVSNRRPTPHPFSFFHNKTDGDVSFSPERSPNHELADTTETTTTAVVVGTW